MSHAQDRSSPSTTPVCYCFQHTQAELQADIAAGLPFRTFEAIRDRCGQGEAHCTELNPQGVCCLSQIREQLAQLGGPPLSAGSGEKKQPRCCPPSE